MKKIVLVLYFFGMVACYSQVDHPNDSITRTSGATRPESETYDTINRDAEPLEADYTSPYYFISQKEFWLAISVLIALIVILILELKLIRERGLNNTLSIRLILVTIVILSTLFIIMSGYDENQIAPIYGLFGTICGYLFGRSGSDNNAS